ncbi:adenosylmethionine--8-amino-7-oxononanoate transaminase [Hydrogenimonas sp.]
MDRATFDREHLWHPYASVLNPYPMLEVVRTEGVRLHLSDGRELVDGMSSWWSAIHGYGHPHIVGAVKRQLERMPHVMFGGITHPPAVELARRLLDLVDDAFEFVFFADSGSVAVEVAMKMALQYFASVGEVNRSKFLTIRGGYHGDTFGAMSVCDPVTGMHALFREVLPAQIFAPKPSTPFGEPLRLEDEAAFSSLMETHAEKVAAVILEPVVQGAGGLHFYSADFLSMVRRVCDRHGVLLIFDEIATGFGRTGEMFAYEHASVVPDILCLGKALTGGTMTLAATLTTREVAEGVERNGHVLMHGPTFMANPLACSAAIASLELLQSTPWKRRVEGIGKGLEEGLAPCRELSLVKDVRVLGAIGVVELRRDVDLPKATESFVERGVWIRPFKNLIYVMPPYVIGAEELARLTGAIRETVEREAL